MVVLKMCHDRNDSSISQNKQEQEQQQILDRSNHRNDKPHKAQKLPKPCEIL